MESHEVLKEAINTAGVKAVAADMNLSSSLLYKWCESKESEGAGGADNPLDRLMKIYESTGDTGPISWLCKQVDGFFVKNPIPDTDSDTPVLQITHAIVREFSEMLAAVSESYEDDCRIDTDEAARIRKEWEELKSVCETFIVGCERGLYNVKRPGC